MQVYKLIKWIVKFILKKDFFLYSFEIFVKLWLQPIINIKHDFILILILNSIIKIKVHELWIFFQLTNFIKIYLL